MRAHVIIVFTVLLVACVIVIPRDAQAGNKKLMSVNAAKADAQRAIVESVVGLKVRSESVVQDMVAGGFTIDAKTSASIKGIEIVDTVYDPDKDIAKVTARIKLGNVINVIGLPTKYGNMEMERVGFGTSTPQNAAPLQALRAATIHAYQQLAEKVVGLRIDSSTTVENFVLKSDDVKATVLAAIWGAKVTDFGWESDGNAFIKMSLKTNIVKDVIGQTFVGDQGEVSVEGNGSPSDSFSQSQGGGSGGVREQSLGIPVPSAPSDTGGAAAL